MSIFVKPINENEFEDVEVFCDEQIEENRRLEYKKAFSSKDEKKQIAKEISAFANTHGGIILVGVGEKDRKPKLPIDGIVYVKGLNEKVTSIALKNIYPPVFPETKVSSLNGRYSASATQKSLSGSFLLALSIIFFEASAPIALTKSRVITPVPAATSRIEASPIFSFNNLFAIFF